MRPFPNYDIFEPFIGDELVQISYGPNDIQLAFTSGRRIHIEYRVEHTDPQGVKRTYECEAFKDEPQMLHRLLQSPVTSIERTDMRVEFNFQTGAKLSLETELGPYECGQIFPNPHSQDDLEVF
jgi:hypothetical protein